MHAPVNTQTTTSTQLKGTTANHQPNGAVKRKSSKNQTHSPAGASHASAAVSKSGAGANGHARSNSAKVRAEEVVAPKEEPKPVEKDLLKRHLNDPPSLVLHLYPTYFKFEHQDGFFSYKSHFKDFLKFVKEQRLPPDLVDVFDESRCRYYDGCLIVEIHDHRTKFQDVVHQVPDNTNSEVKRIVLRPTAETLWTDLCLMNESSRDPWTEDLALEVEAKILLATEEPLCLDPSIQVTRVSNAINYKNSPQPSKRKRKWNSTEREEELAKKAESDKLMTLMDERAQRPFPFQPNFNKISFVQEWRAKRQKLDNEVMPAVESKKGKGRRSIVEPPALPDGRKCIRTLRFERQADQKKVFTVLNVYMLNNEYDGVLRTGTVFDTSIDGHTMEFKIGPEYVVETFVAHFKNFYMVDNKLICDNNPAAPVPRPPSMAARLDATQQQINMTRALVAQQQQAQQGQLSQSQLSQSQLTQPQLAQAQLSQPQLAQAQLTQPQLAQTQISQPQLAQPQNAQSQSAQPQNAPVVTQQIQQQPQNPAHTQPIPQIVPQISQPPQIQPVQAAIPLASQGPANNAPTSIASVNANVLQGMSVPMSIATPGVTIIPNNVLGANIAPNITLASPRPTATGQPGNPLVQLGYNQLFTFAGLPHLQPQRSPQPNQLRSPLNNGMQFAGVGGSLPVHSQAAMLHAVQQVANPQHIALLRRQLQQQQAGAGQLQVPVSNINGPQIALPSNMSNLTPHHQQLLQQQQHYMRGRARSINVQPFTSQQQQQQMQGFMRGGAAGMSLGVGRGLAAVGRGRGTPSLMGGVNASLAGMVSAPVPGMPLGMMPQVPQNINPNVAAATINATIGNQNNAPSGDM